MLNPEYAKERLKEFEVDRETAEKARRERFAALPEDLRAVAFPLIDRAADGKHLGAHHGPAERQKVKEDAWAAMDATLTPAQRLAIFSAWHPGLGPSLAAVWTRTDALYLTGWQKRPYRAPGRPDLTRTSRENQIEYLTSLLTDYPNADAVWLAQWAPYIGSFYQLDAMGRLFATVIDAGGPDGDAVLTILRESGNGEHEIGAMGRHVTTGLMGASRPEGWEWCEKLLLAAQRQEGLRQNVLETIAEAHPEAFRRMLRVIRENDLSRFAAVTHAAGQWFGFPWDNTDAPTAKTVDALLLQVETLLADKDAARAVCVPGGETDGQTAHLALWTLAFDDAPATVAPASRILAADPSTDRRYAALRFLSTLSLPEASPALLAALDDPDVAISAAAYTLDRSTSYYTRRNQNEGERKEYAAARWDALVRNLPRYPKSATFGPLVWPWETVEASAAMLADELPQVRGDRPHADLLPFVPKMSSSGRQSVASQYADAKTGPKDDAARAVLLGFASDLSTYVRDTALTGLERFSVDSEANARELEALLTRKGGDLRRSVVRLLLKQDDAGALASARRLLAAKPSSAQRPAGLDLLKQLRDQGRAADEARAVAREYVSANPDVPEEQRELIRSLTEDAEASGKPTFDDALGLMNPANRTPAVRPSLPEPTPALATDAARRLIVALDAWVEQHAKTAYRVGGRNADPDEDDEDRTGASIGGREVLLGDTPYLFPSPDWNKTVEEQRAALPLFELFEAWWQDRPADTRDPDGREALRAAVALDAYDWNPKAHRSANRDDLSAMHARLFAAVPKKKRDEADLKHEALVEKFLNWAVRLFVCPDPADPSLADFLLDAAATTLALVPDAELSTPIEQVRESYWTHTANEWRESSELTAWVGEARAYFLRARVAERPWDAARTARLWRLLRWLDEPFAGANRSRPNLEFVAAARAVEAANDDDLYDLLLGPRPTDRHHGGAFPSLSEVTARKPHPLLATTPGLAAVADRCRARVLEIELARGDTETLVTNAALALGTVGGADILARLVGGLNPKEKLVRNYEWREQNRAGVFSRLIRRTAPGPDDTPERFAEKMRAAKVGEQRIVEIAVYAPQWAVHAEAMLGWPLLSEAVWWLHAHTKESGYAYGEQAELREAWKAQVAERTPLTAEDLTEGAVDVAWFRRVREALGDDRWRAVDEAARYASSAGGHKRAQLFADAMLGRLEEADLRAKITVKRSQDSLRALGLLPLPGDDTRAAVALSRYEAVQEFRRGSKQFGSMKQESEKLASRIALENLARSAGYPDPARLEWAMEAHAVADLRSGPVSATAGEVTVTLSIDPLGRPDLAFVKAGRALKSLPPAAKKEPTVAALVERRKALERQASRMRLSLEEAMVRGDRFTAAETQELLAHPLLTPLLRSLVFVADGVGAMGFPTVAEADGGLTLEDGDGATVEVASDEALRIAHPYDLYRSGRWDRWQRDCFLRERIQPFKQVFRELYLVTDAETEGDGRRSLRYAGHQVNPKRAYALLARRGWVVPSEYDEEESGPRRAFHDARLTASLAFAGWTGSPADVDGLTLEGVSFTRRGEWKPLPLPDIPPRLFSETMRDLDLVVSVAHKGGVDPEASQSTVEMRAAVVREAATLLKLDNVRIERSHAIIAGTLGTFTVHLGSAIVHRQPGGFVCIVPVHGQGRGRVFLPFLDDDPRTAEVVSKVLLLAKDQEIKDPTILEQILAVK